MISLCILYFSMYPVWQLEVGLLMQGHEEGTRTRPVAAPSGFGLLTTPRRKRACFKFTILGTCIAARFASPFLLSLK